MIATRCDITTPLGWHCLSKAKYLSNSASCVWGAFRCVKDRHSMLHCLPLLKKACVRQVALDKLLPLNPRARSRPTTLSSRSTALGSGQKITHQNSQKGKSIGRFQWQSTGKMTTPWKMPLTVHGEMPPKIHHDFCCVDLWCAIFHIAIWLQFHQLSVQKNKHENKRALKKDNSKFTPLARYVC